MAISVTDQALDFLGALILGGALGVLYDLFRLVQIRLGLRALGAALDLSYWAVALAALFSYCLAAGNGDVRIYLMVGIALGGGLYFLTLSEIFRCLGNKLWEIFIFLGNLCLKPLILSRDLSKMICENLKKDFHYIQKMV